jgi:hypothetical protein
MARAIVSLFTAVAADTGTDAGAVALDIEGTPPAISKAKRAV